MNRVLVFSITVILGAWNALNSNAKHLNAMPSSLTGDNNGERRVPTVKHMDILPRLELTAKEISGPARLRRRGVTDIGNVFYSSL